MMNEYIPHQGDIVYLNMNTQVHTNQTERRPALVVSSDFFNQITQMVIICPIVNSSKEFPLHLQLPPTLQTTGKILCEHLRSVDGISRQIEFVEKLDVETLAEALDIIAAVLEVD